VVAVEVEVAVELGVELAVELGVGVEMNAGLRPQTSDLRKSLAVQLALLPRPEA
jgi:hypothetical protein